MEIDKQWCHHLLFALYSYACWRLTNKLLSVDVRSMAATHNARLSLVWRLQFALLTVI